MSSYKEKLSILSEMIAFARVDDAIKEQEYLFLLSVAKQLGVEIEVFEGLLDQASEHVIPQTEEDRIIHFHRLVLLMNVDRKQEEAEIVKLHNIGLGMGLPPTAITQVLTIMHNYPNKIVPPNVLIDIFKAHYN